MRITVFVVILALVGCGTPAAPPAKPVANTPKPSTPAEPPHSHGAGPNGGAIGDWGGGKYHVEFTVDHDKKQATIYVLGEDAKTPAPIRDHGCY